jgi:hypothetical protein
MRVDYITVEDEYANEAVEKLTDQINLSVSGTPDSLNLNVTLSVTFDTSREIYVASALYWTTI